MLRRRGQVERGAGGALRLAPAGMEAARGIVRSHRLWETYLAEHLGLPPDHLHEPSHRAEHFISPAMRQELGREVGRDGDEDPHGREIPREGA
jgi:Mn-dependent DtxR family transcriptional regulator